MFWNRFVALCNEKNTSPTAVVNAIGMAGGSVTKWKNGSVPTDATIMKLADYLSVSPDYLAGRTEQRGGGSAEEEELNEYLEELKNRSEMRMLFSLAKGATKEDVEQAVAIIEALRKGRNG